MDDIQDSFGGEVDDAIAIASSALENLDRIVSEIPDLDTDVIPQPLLDLQTQLVPEQVALESAGSSVRTVVKTIVATISRMVSAIIDFMRSEQHSARRCMDACTKIIEASTKIDKDAVPRREVTNGMTMMAISYEGNCSRYMARELDTFYAAMIRLRSFSPHAEARDLIRSFRNKDEREISSSLDKLHASLEQGLKALGNSTTKASSAVYLTCDDAMGVYSTSRLFGDRFIFGQISKIDNGSFKYGCMVRRDPSTRMRVKTFPVLKPNDISLTAKSVRAYCEDFLRNVDIESKLFGINREAMSLSYVYDSRVGIKELRTVVDSFQNVYIVGTRHAMYISRNVVNYLSDCIRAY